MKQSTEGMIEPTFIYHEEEAPEGKIVDAGADGFDAEALAAKGWCDTPAKFRGALTEAFKADPEALTKADLQRLAFYLKGEVDPKMGVAKLHEVIEDALSDPAEQTAA